jgi:hypothetical protein
MANNVLHIEPTHLPRTLRIGNWCRLTFSLLIAQSTITQIVESCQFVDNYLSSHVIQLLQILANRYLQRDLEIRQKVYFLQNIPTYLRRKWCAVWDIRSTFFKWQGRPCFTEKRFCVNFFTTNVRANMCKTLIAQKDPLMCVNFRWH